jgi:hypothetical protein
MDEREGDPLAATPALAYDPATRLAAATIATRPSGAARIGMATTTGLVCRLTISADGSAEVEVGQSPARASTLSLVIQDTDSPSTITAKRGMLDVLSTALLAHTEVVAQDSGGELTSVTVRQP